MSEIDELIAEAKFGWAPGSLTGRLARELERCRAERDTALEKVRAERDERGSTMTTICLASIVKNEEQNIRRLIENAKAYCDYAVIVDTGSTDRTLEILEGECMKWDGLTYTQRGWKNFAHNRNESLQLARDLLRLEGALDDGAYLLVLDADEELTGTMPPLGEADLLLVKRTTGDCIGRLPTLFRANLPFAFKGSVHEYLACEGTTQRKASLANGLEVKCHPGSVRSRDPNRVRGVIELLQADLEADPNDPHAAFYMAQSWLALGEHQKAFEWYQKRAGMGGSPELTWYAQYMVGVLLAEFFHRPADAVSGQLGAWLLRPNRAEALAAAAEELIRMERFSEALWVAAFAFQLPIPDGETCFVRSDVYGAHCQKLLAIAAAGCGKTALADAMSK